jgi:hypothetical protein
MNCKPGDLAIIFTKDLPSEINLIGKIVKVIKSRQNIYKPEVMVWDYDGDYLKDLDGAEIYALADDYLRPVSGLPLQEEIEAINNINQYQNMKA